MAPGEVKPFYADAVLKWFTANNNTSRKTLFSMALLLKNWQYESRNLLCPLEAEEKGTSLQLHINLLVKSHWCCHCFYSPPICSFPTHLEEYFCRKYWEQGTCTGPCRKRSWPHGRCRTDTVQNKMSFTFPCSAGKLAPELSLQGKACCINHY